MILEQNNLSLHVTKDYLKFQAASKLFNQPFHWLLEILKDMTRFSAPSGYATINRQFIVTKIWVGETNEYGLYSILSHVDRCIYIDNFESHERINYGWKNLNRNDIEKTFNISFSDYDLDKIGGFPKNMMLYA